ncbi:unnamed protein product [Rotaria sordida]|uniref:Uncharacterized protein n=1 Tax=Rotaria sordida TaxID=392033 RepID=A0A815CLC9_9BILA|nr:unnamed protein product [Rotaria sordida]
MGGGSSKKITNTTPARTPTTVIKPAPVPTAVPKTTQCLKPCYCPSCYDCTQPDVLIAAGSKYTVPRGLVAFGIQVDNAFAASNKIFDNWYTTFYGTSKDKLEDIIRNRFVPFPGDHLLSGGTFVLTLRDQKHIYTSPSINYASLEHVCPIDTMTIDGTSYDFQVVLQCKQNPADVQKLRSGKPNVCKYLPDADVQWRTDQRSSVVPISLLICAKKR